jgi:hypothetical protein
MARINMVITLFNGRKGLFSMDIKDKSLAAVVCKESADSGKAVCTVNQCKNL